MKKAEPTLNKIELLNIFKNLRNQGSKLIDSGKYEDTIKALPCFLDALSISKKLYDNQDNPDTADILHTLGSVYRRLEETSNDLKALDFYQQSLAMRQSYYGNVAHAQIANSLVAVGEMYQKLGGNVNKLRHVEFATKALEMQRKLYQDQAHPNMIYSLCSAAEAHDNLGNDENLGKSIGLLEQALDMANSYYGQQPNVQTAHILHSIATYYSKLGDIDSINKALYNFQKALDIDQKLSSNISLEVAITLSNMGVLHDRLAALDSENKQKHLKSCLEYTKKVFDIYQELYGSHIHPRLAQSMQDMSVAYIKLGGDNNINQAYQLQQQVLKMNQELYPDDHPKTLECLDILSGFINSSPELHETKLLGSNIANHE